MSQYCDAQQLSGHSYSLRLNYVHCKCIQEYTLPKSPQKSAHGIQMHVFQHLQGVTKATDNILTFYLPTIQYGSTKNKAVKVPCIMCEQYWMFHTRIPQSITKLCQVFFQRNSWYMDTILLQRCTIVSQSCDL